MIDIEDLFKGIKQSDLIIYNDDRIEFQPFAFVLNVRELVGTNSIELAQGYTLRRALKSEVEYIKEFLTKTFRSYGTMILGDSANRNWGAT